jgi:hypothetical protein
MSLALIGPDPSTSSWGELDLALARYNQEVP